MDRIARMKTWPLSVVVILAMIAGILAALAVLAGMKTKKQP
jgi:uncharacterized integral membrane protein